MFGRLKNFLTEVWREVRPIKGRVTWPSMKSIKVSTVVVVVSAVFLSFYIFACDVACRGLMQHLRPQ